MAGGRGAIGGVRVCTDKDSMVGGDGEPLVELD